MTRAASGRVASYFYEPLYALAHCLVYVSAIPSYSVLFSPNFLYVKFKKYDTIGVFQLLRLCTYLQSTLIGKVKLGNN